MSIYVAVAYNLLAAILVLTGAVAYLERKPPKPKAPTDYTRTEILPNYAEVTP